MTYFYFFISFFFFKAIEIVDWISSTISLLRLIVIKQTSSNVVQNNEETFYSKQFDLIWNQLYEILSNCLQNIPHIISSLEQLSEVSKHPKEKRGEIFMRKYELIQLNLQDTFQLLKKST